jgi:hypothetical protein
MNCNQCQMLSINGVVCHETGCPNMGKKFIDGQWLTVYHCTECGSQHTDSANMQACCVADETEFFPSADFCS